MALFADPHSYKELEEIGWPSQGASEAEVRGFLNQLIQEEQQARAADAWIQSLPEKYPELARPNRAGGIGVGTTTPKDGYGILRSITSMDPRALRGNPFKAQIEQIQNEAGQFGVDLGELRGIGATGLNKGPLSSQQSQGLTRQGGRAFSINTPLASKLLDAGIDPNTADIQLLSSHMGESANKWLNSGIADGLLNKVGPIALSAVAGNIASGLAGFGGPVGPTPEVTSHINIGGNLIPASTGPAFSASAAATGGGGLLGIDALPSAQVANMGTPLTPAGLLGEEVVAASFGGALPAANELGLLGIESIPETMIAKPLTPAGLLGEEVVAQSFGAGSALSGLDKLKNVSRAASLLDSVASQDIPPELVSTFPPSELPPGSPVSRDIPLSDFSGEWSYGLPYNTQAGLLAHNRKAPDNYFQGIQSPYFNLLSP